MMNIDDRRKHGVFYTPKILADYAHERLSKVLKDNWKEEFIVWDNCAGTCNLTKDYKFKELYISTLFDSEVEEGMQFNPEAEHFQFDFLNDEIPNPGSLFNSETKIPDRLLDAFKKNKKILFLINPPYTTGVDSRRGQETKTGSAITKINKQMVVDGYGKSAQNLYSQFLYRIEKLKQEYKLTDCYIGIFCPTLFMTGPAFDKFRLYFLNDFEYIDGFLFLASHFADVSAAWGIGFTIWKSGISKNKDNFEIDICDVNKNSYTGDIDIKTQKCLYNTDNRYPASEWVREELNKKSQKDKVIFPHISSGIKISQKDNQRLFKNNLGSVYFLANNVSENPLGVSIASTILTKGSASISNSILPENFYKVVSLFSARKLIMPNWINSKDEYLAPDESNPDFKEFANDSVIFSLFNSASNQSSLRNIEYKNKEKNNE